jgi:hypothetical protein
MQIGVNVYGEATDPPADWQARALMWPRIGM